MRVQVDMNVIAPPHPTLPPHITDMHNIPCVFKLTWTLLPHPTPPFPPVSQICILYCGFLGTCMVLVGIYTNLVFSFFGWYFALWVVHGHQQWLFCWWRRCPCVVFFFWRRNRRCFVSCLLYSNIFPPVSSDMVCWKFHHVEMGKPNKTSI